VASSLDRERDQVSPPQASDKGGCGGNSWLNWWRGPVEVNTDLFDNVNQFDNLTRRSALPEHQ